MVKAKKYVLVKAFSGEPKRDDIAVVEEDLPALKDGEFLAEAEYWSVDPYMRAYMASYPIPSDMIGSQVAIITESKNPKYPVGKRVVGYFGWRTHTISNGTETFSGLGVVLLPDLGTLSPSLGLGVLGMPGNTSYFGFLEICKPKAGETVVVTGAAGAVGSHVGQIAKIYGCRVIGFAGSDEKCDYIKELGFDEAINYKTANVADALKKAAPNGVDCYFDNVGGELSSIILSQMNIYGRVSCCGSISSYNADVTALPKASIIQPSMVFKQLKMEGFLVWKWKDRSDEAVTKNLEWVKEGKLKYKETVWNGFDKMFDAFIGMLRGENTGKAIIKA